MVELTLLRVSERLDWHFELLIVSSSESVREFLMPTNKFSLRFQLVVVVVVVAFVHYWKVLTLVPGRVVMISFA